MAFDEFRQKASECLGRARRFLAEGDDASVRHAALELRFCIEYITYDLLVVYLEEVPDDTVKKWTPKQVIDALRDVDPAVDQTVTIAVGLEDEPGVPAKEMHWLGADRRFSVKWANSNHNALGNFLHAPTLEQIQSKKVVSLETMTQKVTAVADELAEILASPVFRVNFGEFRRIDCPACGTTIKRRSGPFSEKGLSCRATSCGATFDVVAPAGQKMQCHLRTSSYNCPGCAAANQIGAHLVKPGATLECATCHRRFVIALSLKALEPPPVVDASGGGAS